MSLYFGGILQNGSVDTGDSDDCDSVHESSPSTPGSEQEEIIGILFTFL